jgi:hypothetical protein
MDTAYDQGGGTAAAAGAAFPAGSNLGAIVARMQERAIVVTNEEDVLQRAKENLEQVQQEYDAILTQRKEVRQQYLQQQVDENSAELESIQSGQEIAAKQTIVAQLQKEGADNLAWLDKDKQKWTDGIETEVGQQRRRQMLYLSYLQGLVTAKEESMQQRSDRLALVKDRTEDQKVAILQLRQRDEHVRTVELPEAKNQHGAATADADKLAKQVREAIATVRLVLIVIYYQITHFCRSKSTLWRHTS